MNGYAYFAYGLFGKWTEHMTKDATLQKRLLQAHFTMRASAFLAALYLTAILAGAFGAVLALVLAIATSAPAALIVLLPVVFGSVFAGLVIAIGPLWLQNMITERAKEIDENLAHGMHYMLALANAGLPPREIWRSLARAEVFGALATEAARITRDLDLFNYDILKALRLAQDRTASAAFVEFLQGAISAFQSGVELKSYLRTKGDQYQHRAIEQQLKDMDTMGVMAETFLVMVVAAPLFLIILLTVMAINQGDLVISLGFGLSLVFIPLSQTVIGALIKGMTPKVWT